MTRRCIHSLLRQDIPVQLMVADNGSDCGQYLRSLPNLHLLTFPQPLNLHRIWNMMLEQAFEQGAQHALVVNNDTVLSPWTYRMLVEDGGWFVTAVGSKLMLHEKPTHPLTRRPHPDFSCFLIRRECYEMVGPFDQRFHVYCGDNDYHLRMHELGITACSLNLPFYHEASGTLKHLPEEEADAIRKLADLDRKRFNEKWGCETGSPEYYAKFIQQAIPHSPDL